METAWWCIADPPVPTLEKTSKLPVSTQQKKMNYAYSQVHRHGEGMWVILQTQTPREKKQSPMSQKNASFMSLALWPQSPSAAWMVSRQAAFQPEAPERLSLFESCKHLGRALVLMLSDYHHSLLTHTWTNKLYEKHAHAWHTDTLWRSPLSCILVQNLFCCPILIYIVNEDKQEQYSDLYVISCRNIIGQIADLMINCWWTSHPEKARHCAVCMCLCSTKQDKQFILAASTERTLWCQVWLILKISIFS